MARDRINKTITKANDLAKVPRPCMIIQGVLTRPSAHLPSAHADRIHVHPEAFRVFAIRACRVFQIIWRVFNLAGKSMVGNVKFGEPISRTIYLFSAESHMRQQLGVPFLELA